MTTTGDITVDGIYITASSFVIDGETVVAATVNNQSSGTINISGGELECSGKMDQDGTLTISGGTLDINGEYESSTSSAEAISGGTITCAGEWDASNDDEFTPTGGTVVLDGAGDRILRLHSSSNFFNLTISNSSGDVHPYNTVDVDGDLTISSGADLDIDYSAENITIEGSFTNSGTLTSSGETITFDGSGDKTSSGIINTNLDVVVSKSSSGSVTFTGTCSFDEFTVSDGKAAIGSNTITCGNTVSIADGKTLEIGTGTFNSDATFNANTSGIIDTGAGRLECSSSVTSLGTLSTGAGTVEYDGGSQNVLADAYYNLEIDQSGTKTSQGTITVAGDMTVQSGATYAVAATTTTVTGTRI